MMHSDLGPAALWLMLLLGAWHGINPAMGWLFAVALGLQEGKGRAVARSLAPIALGHALAVGGLLLLAVFLGRELPPEVIRYAVAAILIALGVTFLIRHRHPRWVRMQVGFRDLTAWSFLIASAHGAGLMLLPVLLAGSTVEAAGHSMHRHAQPTTVSAALLATGVHTLGYIAVTGLVAWIVYSKVGLTILRKAWLNLDIIWASALLATGLITLAL